MSEMIERVARAIANAHGDAWDDVPDSKAEWTELRGEFGNRFRGVDENFKADYRDEARAAIEAMRKPTKEMVGAMGLAWAVSSMRPPDSCSVATFQRMFDYAINEALAVATG